jgi:hypothetical protein
MTRSHTSGALLGLSVLVTVAGQAAQTPVQGTAQPPAQAAPAQAPAPASGTSPAQSVGLYVFPQKGQADYIQHQDEVNCYNAAKTASGVDPTRPQAPTYQAAQSEGGGVRGGARGAAGGAAIGAIAGNAGAGAAAGALVGGVRGRRQQDQANAQAQQQAAQQTAAAQQQQINSFKRAMTACLESHNYSVK